MYVANQDTKARPDTTASVIDTRSNRVAATLTTGKGCHGAVVSEDGRFAFMAFGREVGRNPATSAQTDTILDAIPRHNYEIRGVGIEGYKSGCGSSGTRGTAFLSDRLLLRQ